MCVSHIHDMRGPLRYVKNLPFSKRLHHKRNQIQPSLEYTFLKFFHLAGRISQKSLLTRTSQNKAHVVSALSSRVRKYNKDETYTVLVLEGRLTDISIQSELTLYG